MSRPVGFDSRQLRREFPIFANNPGLVFLDSGASAQKPSSVIDRIADYYRTYYASTDWRILQHRRVPAGRLYVDRQADALHVVDISLLPDWRGRGIGTAIMQAVCAEARDAGKAVVISVEKYNRAQRLYRRLGFREASDQGVYWFMEWRAAPDDQLNTAS